MTPAEVQFLLAAPAASSGYSVPGTVYNSNGKYCSTTQVNTVVAANNIFPDLTGAQNAALQVDYQCIFVYNSDPTTTMTNTYVWMPSSSILGASPAWAYAADPTGASAYNTVNQQALLIANPQTAPVGITTWVAPVASASLGLALGNVSPRQVFPFWIRRTATGVASASAGFSISVTFDVV